MSNEQRRQLIDIQQVYAPFREAERQFLHSYDGKYAGSMRWVKRNGTEYLYRKIRNVEKSLGPKSPETERIKADYIRQRSALRVRLNTLRERLEAMAPVNKALRLNRVPSIAAKIISALSDTGLLGKHLVVVGTNSLYAYEARAGVLFSSELVATGDADFLFDARRTLKLALHEARAAGVIGILQKIDRSFSTGAMYGYSATNDAGYIVELICPEDPAFMRSQTSAAVSDVAGDLEPMPIEGLRWLVNAPKIEETVIGEDGMPLTMVCVDPRVFALHKMWVSKQPSRSPLKRRRDEAQARAVAALCESHLQLQFDAKDLTALPESIRAFGPELTSA